jgi:protocatechuate 3,4-dioxygenase beta subunit
MDERLSRRRLFELGAAATALPILVAACGEDEEPTTTAATESDSGATTAGPGGQLEPTPACDDGDEATPEQTEGPFFIPDSPQRTSISDGSAGTALVVAGLILGTDCEPIAGALLDFWQANDDGEYDNSGYTLRGHQFTDTKGRYRLETIVPAVYPGRTRHIHVKAQPENGTMLTTQLYFPDEPQNQSDGIFDERLLMDVTEAGDGLRARFDFVLAA